MTDQASKLPSFDNADNWWEWFSRRVDWMGEILPYVRDSEFAARNDGAELRKMGLTIEGVVGMRRALERLRDCDWVITPRDRMDAVRDIARAALTNSTEGKEK